MDSCYKRLWSHSVGGRPEQLTLLPQTNTHSRRLLSSALLGWPKGGKPLLVHNSLPAPVQWTLLENFTYTEIAIMVEWLKNIQFSTTEAAITVYFGLGLRHETIVNFLERYHGINLSLQLFEEDFVCLVWNGTTLQIAQKKDFSICDVLVRNVNSVCNPEHCHDI